MFEKFHINHASANKFASLDSYCFMIICLLRLVQKRVCVEFQVVQMYSFEKKMLLKCQLSLQSNNVVPNNAGNHPF